MPPPRNRAKAAKARARNSHTSGPNLKLSRALGDSTVRRSYADDLDDADGWTPIANTLCSIFQLPDLSTRSGLKKVHSNFDAIYAKLNGEYERYLSNDNIRGGIMLIYSKLCLDAVLRNKLFERGLLDKLLPLFEVESLCHMALRALSNITHHGGVDIRTAIAFKTHAITALVDKYPSDPIICELAVSILSHTVLACTEGPEHDASIPETMKKLDMTKILKTAVHCMTQPFSGRSCIEHGASLLAWSTLHATKAHQQVPETAKILVAGLRSPDWGMRSICFGGLQRLLRRDAQLEMDAVNPQSFLSLEGRFPPRVNDALMDPFQTDLYRTTSAIEQYMQAMTNFPRDRDLYSLGMKLSKVILATEYSIWDSFYDVQRYNPLTGECDDRGFKLPFNRWSDALPLCANAIREKGLQVDRDAANILDIKYLILRQRTDDAADMGREGLKHNPSLAYYYYAISIAADRTNGLRAAKQGLRCRDTTTFVKFQLMQRAVDHAAELGFETLQYMPAVGGAEWELGISLLRSAVEDAKKFMEEAPPDNRYMKPVVYWFVLLTLIITEDVNLDSPDIKRAMERLKIAEDVAEIVSNGPPDTMLRRTYHTVTSLLGEATEKYGRLFKLAAEEKELPDAPPPTDKEVIQSELASWLDKVVLDDGEADEEHHGGHDHCHKRDLTRHVHEIAYSNDAAEADRRELYRCSYCGNPSAGLRKCSGCAKARYCDAGCQKGHWKEHKRECKS